MNSVNDLSVGAAQVAASRRWPARAAMPSPSPASSASRCRPPTSTWATLRSSWQRSSTRRSDVASAADDVLASVRRGGRRREARPEQARRHRHLDLLPQLAALSLARGRPAVLHRDRQPLRPGLAVGRLPGLPLHRAAASSRQRSRPCRARRVGAGPRARAAAASSSSPVQASGQVAAPGQPVLLSADVTGAEHRLRLPLRRLLSTRRPTRSTWPTWTTWRAPTSARSAASTTRTGATGRSSPWSSSGSR